MSTVDCGHTIDDLFLRAPGVTQDDISESLSDNDIQLIDEFEDAWKEFLSSRPGILPPGQKIKNFRSTLARMNEIDGKKHNVCLELQRQLDFFENSRGKMEEEYSKAKEEASLQQKNVVMQLEEEIDNIAVADKLLSEVLPWEHFFDNLESNTTTVSHVGGSVASLSNGTSKSQVIRPSSDALYLANIQPGEVVYAARRGKSSAHLLRAYRIDNALLKAKVAMIKRETDRLEKTLRSDQLLSEFLIEKDVWGILASKKK